MNARDNARDERESSLEIKNGRIQPKGWDETVDAVAGSSPEECGLTSTGEWPEPTIDAPDMAEIAEYVIDSTCEATDGCTVEPDGTCEHGHPSWLLHFGMI